jgi:two-component system NtrC family sensor kinase
MPWILRATIDFGEFNNLVEFLRIGETGIAFILNADGQFQTKPIAGVDTDDMIGLIKDSRLTDQSNLVIRKSTPDGIEVIYAMAQLKGGDWTMSFNRRLPMPSQT